MGQTEPTQPHDYNSIITILSKLPNWPVFDWGQGVRINDKDLKEVIVTNKILPGNLNLYYILNIY